MSRAGQHQPQHDEQSARAKRQATARCAFAAGDYSRERSESPNAKQNPDRERRQAPKPSARDEGQA